MRIVLVGRPSDRDRLRPLLLEAGLEISAEMNRRPDAAAVLDGVDAIVEATPARNHGPSEGSDPAGMFPPETLTPREQDVLHLLADGLSNKAIAASLGISDQTVNFHVAAIIGKLGASNRTDAVRRAIRLGLVPI